MIEQDEVLRMARELATRHGTRMCDEDGETHGEELYCVDVDDIAEIIKQVAAHEREACAKVCEEIAVKEWDAYKGRTEPIDKDKLYNPHIEGISDGADECAAAIRARGEKC